MSPSLPISPPPEWLDLFLRSSSTRSYPAETTIIHPGDVPDALYYIVEGSVRVSIVDFDGREIVLAYLNAGDFFGEMGLFDADSERSALVETRGQCELAIAGYDEIRQLMAQQPEILFALAKQMASRLRETSIKFRDQVFLDNTARVATTLLDLASMSDAITHPDGLQLNVTREEISRIAGCSMEMVGRVLRELEDRNLLHAKGTTMVLYGTPA